MSVITKDLGIATAYGYAKSKGYTGTEEEFAELMASYADVAQQAEAAAQDAEDAKGEAVTAKTDAQTAKTAAQAAQSAAETASGAASTKASEAAQSAQTAAGSATAAGNSATAAAGSATTAQTAAQTATTKASEASSSASAASTAKTGAETARTGAQSAQTAAETAQANAEAAASSVSASAAQIEQNTEDIAGLKNDLNQFPSGNYPNMGAGYANQLVSGLKKEDSTPYNFRRIPYDATLEEVEKIVGGTVAWNQLVDANTESVTVISGHKAYKNIGGTASIVISDGTAISVTGGTDIVTDITQMLGTTIADYVYTLETATAGAGVAWLKTHFPKQFDAGYQAYDAGSLQSVSGLTEHKMTGFNQFDGEYEAGYYDTSDGSAKSSTSWGRSKNTVKCLPNTTYCYKQDGAVSDSSLGYLLFYDANDNYLNVSIAIAIAAYTTGHVFTTPNGCYGIKFYNNIKLFTESRICINLHWDGEKDGTYEPYKTWSYALDDSVTLRGIPKVDANGNLYYDGDEYLPDGTVNRRYREIDFDGNEGWTLQSINSSGIANFALDLGANNKYTNGPHAVCNRFKAQITSISETTEEGFILSAPQYLYIRISSSKADTVTGFKTWLASNPTQLMFELATPTTETADPYTTPQIIAPDGTEEYIYEDGAFELPVGHSSDYPVDVSGQLDDILDTPSANGTYTLKATVADGAVSYSWVADA